MIYSREPRHATSMTIASVMKWGSIKTIIIELYTTNWNYYCWHISIYNNYNYSNNTFLSDCSTNTSQTQLYTHPRQLCMDDDQVDLHFLVIYSICRSVTISL